MKIKTITSQHRRDFQAIYSCEHCSKEVSGYGYDDEHFHLNVIPKMVCIHCGKTSPVDYVPRSTKYVAHEVI